MSFRLTLGDRQTANSKATLFLKPEEPVSHPVTTLVIQLELSLYRLGERTWEGEKVTA